MAGFVHRDIKPANISIGRNDTGRLLDLGIADRPLAHPTIERIWGTPGESIAPEGYRGEVSSQGDVWAHAATAYRVLTGVPAFETPEERTVLGITIKRPRALVIPPVSLIATSLQTLIVSLPKRSILIHGNVRQLKKCKRFMNVQHSERDDARLPIGYRCGILRVKEACR